MAKFNVGDVVRVVSSFGNLSYGKLYTVLYYGKSSSGYDEDDMVGVTAAEPQWRGDCFTLVGPYKKPSLRSLYETEREKLTAQQEKLTAQQEKLTAQQDITTAAWELVVAEKAMEDSARKALIHAKQVEVECVRDYLKEISDRYLQVCNELDEMLRNEHL
jgi:hypothetical protein